MSLYRCHHCRVPVKAAYSPGYGTYWTHIDGIEECEVRHASPNFNVEVDYQGNEIKSVDIGLQLL